MYGLNSNRQLVYALLAATATGAAPIAASAHGIWVAQRHDDFAVVYGHAATDEGYPTDKLQWVNGYSASGEKANAAIVTADDHVLLDLADDVAVVTAYFDNGYWTEDADGTLHNVAKTEVDGAVHAGLYVKYTTTILHPLDGRPEPYGLEFEIVPLVDPMTLHMGDPLPVRVVLDGKPAPDITVIAEYTTDSGNRSIVTDANGEATITVRNQGLNVVAASTTVPLDGNSLADEKGYFSTLAFTLHFHEE